MVLEVGQEMIKTLGYKSLTAKSGREAVDIFQKEKSQIDIVIVDIIMPEMAGSEVIEKLKGIEPDIKILLSSGFYMKKQITKMLGKRCNGFIPKPFNISSLSHQLSEILGSC
jgi:CheY-like chemotaxis protein